MELTSARVNSLARESCMSSCWIMIKPVLIFGCWDMENYTVKNTHVCCLVYEKSTVMSETVHVMPSGNCEDEMTLLLERQMKNIWTGVSVPTEHRQTTTGLSAISTEALSQYQTDLFWHTECYSSGKSAFRDNTSVLLTLTCKRFSPMLSVAQANEIESAPALSNVVQRDTECYLAHSVLTLPVVPYCNLMPSAFEMVT